MTTCVRACGSRGKRPCPALGGSICPTCCGRFRIVEIDCPADCPFLEGEAYQADRRQERGIRRGGEYLRSRLRLFPGEEPLSFAMAIEERIYRFVRAHGPSEAETIAGALDTLRASLGGVEIAALGIHPLTRDLLEAVERDEGPLSRRRIGEASERVKIVARLAEDVRGRAGKSPGYLDLLRPFFEEVTDPRPRPRERDRPGPRTTPGGIIVP